MDILLGHELDRLKKDILTLYAEVEECVSKSVQSLIRLDADLAQSLLRKDEEIDQMEVDMEEECLKVLALYQPVASDLRFIITILKINNDLERIADLAVNIAERAITLANVSPVQAPFDPSSLGKKVLTMLDKSFDSFIKLNTDLAYEVLTLDDEVDLIHKNSYGKVGEMVLKAPDTFTALSNYLSASRHLERIADLTTNIAEDVIYLVKGDIVRHKTEFLTKPPLKKL
ncbi:MAG: phosphate signaling complex protein PhoU [Deltaproteobacteria bacterium]|nr:phosphate signaling complex protein PhoU [Deltaproteobacteria bacterium]